MINETLEKLIAYAKIHLGLKEMDSFYLRNMLFDMFKVEEPYEGKIDLEHITSLSVPDELLDELKEFIPSGEEDYYLNEVMGILSPRPDEIKEKFWELYKEDPKKATDYLFESNVKNYYVQKTKVDKNIEWVAPNGLEITINLSKPEKSNADIKKALASPSNASYPKCIICYEMLGYRGREKFPARQNIRFIPMEFDGDKWFFQYSPYGYFYHHFILVKREHTPMIVSDNNLLRLFDFIDMFPHMVIGSNSDLPITGGSILSHEHFQGGEHVFPMLRRGYRQIFKTNKYSGIKFGIADWYNSVLKFEGENKEEVYSLAKDIVHAWKNYTDEEVDIIAKSNGEQHNSVTPFVQKIDGKYIVYIILRNNITTDEYPDGLYHAHKEYFMIKKEGIGLIEAAGRFILPARLNRQLRTIEEILSKNIKQEEYLKEYPDLEEFVPFIEPLRGKGNYHEEIKHRVEEICEAILGNTAVFKEDEKGRLAFEKFINILDL